MPQSAWSVHSVACRRLSLLLEPKFLICLLQRPVTALLWGLVRVRGHEFGFDFLVTLREGGILRVSLLGGQNGAAHRSAAPRLMLSRSRRYSTPRRLDEPTSLTIWKPQASKYEV